MNQLWRYVFTGIGAGTIVMSLLLCVNSVIVSLSMMRF